MVLKKLPECASSKDLNGMLPINYVLDHPEADTMGGQVKKYQLYLKAKTKINNTFEIFHFLKYT